MPNRTGFAKNACVLQPQNRKQNRVFSKKHINSTTKIKQNEVFNKNTYLTRIFNHKISNRTEISTTEKTHVQPQNSKQNGVFNNKNKYLRPQNAKQNGVLSPKHVFSATKSQTERGFQQNTHKVNHKIPNRTKFSAKGTYFQ